MESDELGKTYKKVGNFLFQIFFNLLYHEFTLMRWSIRYHDSILSIANSSRVSRGVNEYKVNQS